MNTKKIFSCAVLLILSLGALSAKIKMPTVFSDNMLLQRDMPVKIWGMSDANADVEVKFAGQSKKTKADSNGKWSLRLDKMSANKKPQEMSILENGKEGVKIKNILVGEVWIAGGQSNMAFTLEKCLDAKASIARANYPNIRYFKQFTFVLSKKPAYNSSKGGWVETTPKTVGLYGGVPFYFAEKLTKDLDVPVAILYGALGASRMIAWIPEDKISSLEYTKNIYEDFVKRNATYSYEKAKESYKKKRAEWEKLCEKRIAENKKVPQAPQFPNSVSFLSPFATPVYLYNAVISPIEGFTARGVLWYQGESDSNPESLKYFNEQFELVVKSWREKFENPNLAFLTVQLAPFASYPKQDWPLTRWKQYLATKSISKCYITNIIDCGEEKDIHPRDKFTVGTRMEQIALAEIYGKKNIQPYGPVMSSVKYTPDSAEIMFNLRGNKLVGKGEARGFELKIGGAWKPAKAELAGKKVKVYPFVKPEGKIEGVRYLWKAWALPEVWLYNDNNLPAMSFIHEK